MKTIKERVLNLVSRRKVRGTTYTDVHKRFPGTGADRRLRELQEEGKVYSVTDANGIARFYA